MQAKAGVMMCGSPGSVNHSPASLVRWIRWLAAPGRLRVSQARSGRSWRLLAQESLGVVRAKIVRIRARLSRRRRPRPPATAAKTQRQSTGFACENAWPRCSATSAGFSSRHVKRGRDSPSYVVRPDWFVDNSTDFQLSTRHSAMISSSTRPSTSLSASPRSRAMVGATSVLLITSSFVPGLMPAPTAMKVACM